MKVTEEWLVRLLELKNEIEQGQEPARTEKINYLLGYIEALHFIK